MSPATTGARYRTPEEGLRTLESHLRRQQTYLTLKQGRRFQFKAAGKDFVVTTQDGKAHAIARDEVLAALRHAATLASPSPDDLKPFGRGGSYILAVMAAAGLHAGIEAKGATQVKREKPAAPPLPPAGHADALRGRHALVCGASTGIGRAAALELARMGCAVTALARREDALAGVVEELRKAGAPQAHALVADLDDRAALRERVQRHAQQHGPVHILVNNTGGPPSGPLLDAKDDEFLKAFGRHLLASHLLVQALLPGMRQAGYGRIVNVLSTSVREPIPGLGVSNTVRAAMASWAKTLSRELPPGITINSVLPGYTDTERLSALADQMADRQGKSPADIEKGWIAVTPEGRLGRPEEIGAAIAFLCSPAASFVRGIVMPVDGGRLNTI